MQDSSAPAYPQIPPMPRWLVIGMLIISFTILGVWTFATPDGALGKADAVGYAICHRIPERSFSAYGNPLPLCARCTGIYLGVMTGFSAYLVTGRARAMRLPHWKMGIAFALFLIIIAIDGFNSYFHLFPGFSYGLYEPNNTLRVTTGMYTGLALITLVLPIFNNVMWYDDDNRRVLDTWREFGALLLLATAILALTLAEWPLVLVIFGFLSSVGVVLVLTLINSVMVVTFLKRERHYRELADMWLPLLAGLALSILLIGGIDYARYFFTGTWDGFNFPQALLWMIGD